MVVLRPLTLADANIHLAGEDADLVRWLNGGPGSVEVVLAYMERCIGAWENSLPWRPFGVVEASSGFLMGSIDVHTTLPTLAPGVVNLAYGLYPAFRGRGYASRAVTLALAFARREFGSHASVLRMDPENHASHGVAHRCGFLHVGAVLTEEGLLDHDRRSLDRP